MVHDAQHVWQGHVGLYTKVNHLVTEPCNIEAQEYNILGPFRYKITNALYLILRLLYTSMLAIVLNYSYNIYKQALQLMALLLVIYNALMKFC